MKATRQASTLAVLAAILSLAAAATVKAQIVYIDPLSASSSGGDESSPSLTIDGSGMSSAMTTGTPVSAVTADNSSSNMWLNNSFGLSPTITFNLGSVGANYTISSVQIWNLNNTAFGGPEAPTSANILYSTNSGASYTSLGSFSLLDGTGSTGYTGQNIALGSLTGVTNVELQISGNYNGFSSETGLSEVRFEGTLNAGAVPEPSTWAMMFGGLGVLAFIVRRRRQA